MQGFAPERGKWNPDADKNQRTILRDAIARGVTHVDAFSNSAPWFMTVTGIPICTVVVVTYSLALAKARKLGNQ